MVIWYILIAFNVLAFLIYGLDKLKARHHWWRIPEWVLLMMALVGGSLGAWIGMKCFHHKTTKPAFRYGVPIMLLLQSGVVGYYLFTK